MHLRPSTRCTIASCPPPRCLLNNRPWPASYVNPLDEATPSNEELLRYCAQSASDSLLFLSRVTPHLRLNLDLLTPRERTSMAPLLEGLFRHTPSPWADFLRSNPSTARHLPKALFVSNPTGWCHIMKPPDPYLRFFFDLKEPWRLSRKVNLVVLRFYPHPYLTPELCAFPFPDYGGLRDGVVKPDPTSDSL